MLLKQPAFICSSCQLAGMALLPHIPLRPTPAIPCHPITSRSFAQLRSKPTSDRHRPTRMTLSRSVAQPSPPLAPRSSLPRSSKPKPSHGPFAAMNRTTVPASLQTQPRPSPNRHAASRNPSPASSRTRSKHPPDTKRRNPADMKALKMQQALTHIGYGSRASVKANITEVDSFRRFPLLQTILQSIPSEALKGLVDITPTPIQRLAIPALLSPHARQLSSRSRNQFLLAAETGSGKTLAYLLPTVDAVKRAELAEAENQPAKPEPAQADNPLALEAPPLSNAPNPTAGRPRAIILVPTSELVDQIGHVFKAFSHTVKLRIALISAAYSATIIRNRLFKESGIDIVISTPHLLSSIAESDPNILSRVSHLVIDEADSLFDRSFSPITSEIVDRATPSLKQLVLCSATIPRSLDLLLRKRFPRMVRLATPNLHAIPRRVQLSVVDIDKPPYQGNRDLACADAIWQIARGSDESTDLTESKRIIVFVNEREKAIQVAAYLVTKGIDAVALNRDTKEQRSEEIISAFTTVSSEPVSKDAALVSDKHNTKSPSPRAASQRTLANAKVLVMTDLGSRGIDTVAVRHIVLYDVPHTSIDFIHRLGRLGRMGRRGRGIVLVGKEDRKDIVREVREGMFRGQALI